MDTNETMTKLIEYAKAGKHTEFHFIQYWSNYKIYKKQRKAIQLAVKCLKKGCKKLLKNYCKEIKLGTADIVKLVVLTTLSDVLDFYKKELEILNHMVFEYEAYLMEGNLVYAFLGIPRTELELWDHREID